MEDWYLVCYFAILCRLFTTNFIRNAPSADTIPDTLSVSVVHYTQNECLSSDS